MISAPAQGLVRSRGAHVEDKRGWHDDGDGRDRQHQGPESRIRGLPVVRQVEAGGNCPRYPEMAFPRHDNGTVIELGMALALEALFYANAIGVLMIE